jgi:hypothetical protein
LHKENYFQAGDVASFFDYKYGRGRVEHHSVADAKNHPCLIDHLHILDLILNIYPFIRFFKGVISLMVGKMMPVPYKSNEKYKEFEYNFLLICRYLDLVKKIRE